MSETMLKTKDPPGKGGLSDGEAPAAGAGPGMDDADAFIVERIAEAVIRKIDERDKINLLAEAVLERLRGLSSDAPMGVSANETNTPQEQVNDESKEPKIQKGGKGNVNP